MITGYYHSGFVVQDYDTMLAFYRDILGLKIREEFDATGENMSQRHGFENIHLRIAFLEIPGDDCLLELVQYIYPPGEEGHVAKNATGAAHICFYVENLHEMYEELKDKGVRFIGPPVQRMMVGDRIRYVVHGRDPEGNWLEFVEP